MYEIVVLWNTSTLVCGNKSRLAATAKEHLRSTSTDNQRSFNQFYPRIPVVRSTVKASVVEQKMLALDYKKSFMVAYCFYEFSEIICLDIKTALECFRKVIPHLQDT